MNAQSSEMNYYQKKVLNTALSRCKRESSVIEESGSRGLILSFHILSPHTLLYIDSILFHPKVVGAHASGSNYGPVLLVGFPISLVAASAAPHTVRKSEFWGNIKKMELRADLDAKIPGEQHFLTSKSCQMSLNPVILNFTSQFWQKKNQNSKIQ